MITPLVLAAAILVAWMSVEFNPRYVAALGAMPLLAIAFIYLLRYSQYYPLIILLAGLFIPFSLPTGTNSRLVISLVLTMAFSMGWIAKMLMEDKRIALLPSPLNAPLLGFIAVTIISIPWSIYFRDYGLYIWRTFPIVQITSGIVMVMLPVLYLMLANLVKDERVIKIMVAVMLAAGVVGLMSAVFRLYLPVNARGMFALWVVGLAYSLALFNYNLSRYLRIGLLSLALAWMIWNLGFNISWLAGWLPPLIAVLVLSLLKSRKLLLVILLILVVFIVIQWDYIQVAFLAERAESGVTRLDAWKHNWTITREHWLFGTGPAGYAVYYMTYFPTRAMATHSNYIDVLSQVGVIGFALILWFFAAHTWMGYRLVRRVQGRGDFTQAVINAAFAGTVACLVIMGFGDWMFPFTYTQTIAGFDYAAYNWLFMSCLLFYARSYGLLNRHQKASLQDGVGGDYPRE